MFAEFIKNSGKSQRHWAAALNVSEAYLSSLASGRKTPSLDVAVRIERATDGAVPASSWIKAEVAE